MTAGARPQTPASIEFAKRPRFRAELAEERIEARLLPRDCLIDTQEKRLLRLKPSASHPERIEALDAGPLLHELFLNR
jgi:hypothetical protein